MSLKAACQEWVFKKNLSVLADVIRALESYTGAHVKEGTKVIVRQADKVWDLATVTKLLYFIIYFI